MRAITVQQPWAWAIFNGKDIENRTRIGTWRPTVGQRVAIHAGLRWSDRGAHDIRVAAACTRGWPPAPPGQTDAPDYRSGAAESLARAGLDPRLYGRGAWSAGAIIGTVEVADVHPEHGGCCQPWGEASYTEHGGTKRVDIVHLVLENPRPCEPIPCRGALGLWTVPDDIAASLTEVPA